MEADIKERLAKEPGLSRDDKERLEAEITDDVVGYGPLERLLADDSVSEIMVNGPSDIWVEREGRLYATTLRFTDDSHLRRIINKMVAQVGRRIDESSPMVDARLLDGSRANAVIPPLSLSGLLLTIRKFAQKRYELEELVRIGTLTRETVDFLRAAIEAELNILISGGTGSGKTTLLNALSAAIPDSDRIVTIEDAAELQLGAGTRAPARVATEEHRGRGRDRDPRPRAQLAAHAARPDHRRRGPRRGGARHAPGDEHGPRGLALHGARQRAARRTRPDRDHGA